MGSARLPEKPREGDIFGNLIFLKGRWNMLSVADSKDIPKKDSIQEKDYTEVVYIFALVQTIQIIMMIGIIGLIIFK
jgi:hypothetical protein